jgi:hypothetical protein
MKCKPISYHKNPLWLWLFVLCIRAPVLMPFWVVARVGEEAESAAQWLADRLPGLQR